MALNVNNIRLNYFVFRFLSSDDLVSFGEHMRNRERQKPLQANLDYCEDEHYRFITLWNHHLDKDDPALVQEMYGVSDLCKFKSDRAAMEASLNWLTKTKLVSTQRFNIRDKLTGKTPTLDMLISDFHQNNGGFSYPPLKHLEDLQGLRTISSSTASSGHKIMEITIGKSTDNEVTEAITFFNRNYEIDQHDCPTKVISFDVESIHVATSDIRTLPPVHLSTTVDQPNPGVSAKMFPAKLILGGKDWTLSIRSDIDTKLPKGSGTSQTKTKLKPKISYTINMTPVQPILVEFLESIPTATGCAVEHDVVDMEELIRKLGAPKFKFKNGWLDTGVLAVTAGFHSRRRTMFNLNLQVLGGILSKNNSRADGMWSLPLCELPAAFQAYLMGDTRSGYNIYTVLFSSLLRNLFPDPQICCSITQCSQFVFTEWFAAFLIGTLKNLEVGQVPYAEAVTREDLVLSLRIREPKKEAVARYIDPLASDCESEESDDMFAVLSESPVYKPGDLRPHPPERIVTLSKLIPKWPSMVFGSARFLHSVRWFCLGQLDILKDFEVLGVENIWKDQFIDEQLIREATYGQELACFYPQEGSDLHALAPDPNLSCPVARINPDHILNSNLSKIAKKQDRSPRLILNESLRLGTPDGYITLLRRASEVGGPNRENRYWFSCLSKYEEVRTSYMYLTGLEPPVVCDWAEERINKYARKAVSNATHVLQQKESELVAAQKRMHAVLSLQDNGPECKRIRLETKLPPEVPVRQVTDAQRQRRKRKRVKAKLKKAAAYDCAITIADIELPTQRDDADPNRVVTVADVKLSGQCSGKSDLNVKLSEACEEFEQRVSESDTASMVSGTNAKSSFGQLVTDVLATSTGWPDFLPKSIPISESPILSDNDKNHPELITIDDSDDDTNPFKDRIIVEKDGEDTMEDQSDHAKTGKSDAADPDSSSDDSESDSDSESVQDSNLFEDYCKKFNRNYVANNTIRHDFFNVMRLQNQMSEMMKKRHGKRWIAQFDKIASFKKLTKLTERLRKAGMFEMLPGGLTVNDLPPVEEETESRHVKRLNSPSVASPSTSK